MLKLATQKKRTTMRLVTAYSFIILWCYSLSIFSLTSKQEKPHKHSKNKRLHLISNPTGYSLTQGDLYISELAIAYGLTNRFVLSTNLASILGLNESERLNPNLDLKYLLISTSRHRSALGLKFEQYAVTAVDRTTTQVMMEETRDDPKCPRCIKEISRTVLSVEKNLRKWREQIDISSPISNTNNLIRHEYHYKKNSSWSLQLYYAHSLSFLVLKDKQLNLHVGGHLEVNHIAWEKAWFNRPSFRLYSGLDVELSKTLSILGEFFYDPDYYNWLTNKSTIGLDLGIMYAYTPNFNVLFHLQPYFLGFSWLL